MYNKSMKRITMQEFQRYTSKFLKELPFIVTKRGLDDIKVEKIEEKENTDGEDNTGM